MIWKPKEKELTLDEAIAFAKKELAPYWFGQSPQFTAIPSVGENAQQMYSVFPLNSTFVKESWLVLFVDPTGFSGEMSLILAAEFQKRYTALGLKILIVSIAVYSFLKDLTLFHRFIDQWSAKYSVMLDFDSSLSLAFAVQELPRALVLHQSRRQLDLEGEAVFRTLELKLQEYFRKTDPGLSLYPPYAQHMSHVRDLARVELGYRPTLGVPYEFQGTGFQYPVENGVPGVLAGVYGVVQQSDLNLLRVGEVLLSGIWTQDAERIMTTDPMATLYFLSPGAEVGWVAQRLSQGPDAAQIEVESGGAPLLESNVGRDVTLDETGSSIVSVKNPNFYHLAFGLKMNLRLITLRMKNADRVPVAVYGLRFGE